MTIKADKTLDARGLCCPMPSVKTALALETMERGAVLEVMADDPVSKQDLPAWAESTGNTVLGMVEENNMLRIYVKKA